MSMWRIGEPDGIAVTGSSPASAVPLKWAHDSRTGAPRYIHDKEVVDGEGDCTCPACKLVLTPVLAGQPLRVRPTAHFRHPAGSQKDDCSIVAARLAATRHLLELGVIELPRRRMSGTAQGFSGQGYEVWVEAPGERVALRGAVLRDHATALLTLEDGRELLVDLTGMRESADDGSGRAMVTMSLSDPAVAMLDPEAIRARLRILPDIRWCAHWDDDTLTEAATTAAVQEARDSLDGWDDEAEAAFQKVLPGDLDLGTIQRLRRETLLHHQVKSILQGAASIATPSLVVDVRRPAPEEFWGDWNEGELRAEWYSVRQTFKLAHVNLERRVGKVVPDVIATLEARSAYMFGGTSIWVDGDFEEDIEDLAKTACPSTLLIEVTVTHGIDEEKQRRIVELDVPTLEIDIGSLGGRVTLDGLRELVVNQTIGKRWVHHPVIALKQHSLNARLDEHPVTLRHAERLAELRRPGLLATPAPEWAARYLAAVTEYHDTNVAIYKARRTHQGPSPKPEVLGVESEPWARIIEAAEGMAVHGFPGASERIMLSESGLVARILSIQHDRGVGYLVDTGYQVLNAIMQSGSDNKQWDVVYAMAVKAYGLEAKFTSKQSQRYMAWRQAIIDQVAARNPAYLRPSTCDAMLGLVFPELAPGLANGYGKDTL